MRFQSIRMHFYETYYYANIIHNVLCEPYVYLRGMHSWHEDRSMELFLTPFCKRSVLHDFCEYVIGSLIREQASEDGKNRYASAPRIDRALEFHGVKTPGFRAWQEDNRGGVTEGVDPDDLFDYLAELYVTGEMDALLGQLTEEVFHILFSNRGLLFRLHEYVSRIVSDFIVEEIPAEFAGALSKDGVASRVNMPEWAKRAVYHRDRGLCVTCGKDLTGLITVESSKHFDHMIPLAQGGINDITNIQLLCANCNLKKKDDIIYTSDKYQPWYT